jgi:hypothetical protein
MRPVEWEDFILRQIDGAKRRREWEAHKRECKTLDGPVYEELYRDSIMVRDGRPDKKERRRRRGRSHGRGKRGISPGGGT